MKTSRSMASIIAALLIILASVTTVHSEDNNIGLVLPYFEGEGWLTKNVPTALFLQIWPTLRKAPFPNPRGLDFGDGIMRWATYPLDTQNHEAAEKLARDSKVQMTLWGNALTYGDGVVVQTYLSIPLYDDGRKKKNELWTVSMKINGRDYRIEADIPRRYYEFAPITLDRDAVKKYSSPGALKIYRDKELKKMIGVVGDSFEAIRFEGDKVLVDSEKLQGWVRLPSLATRRNEVVDFTGGLIRIFRADWSGAIDLMNRVVRNEETPTSLKVDAYLFQVYAKVRLGVSPVEELKKARELSPNSCAVTEYEVMGDLEQLSKLQKKIVKNNNYSETMRTLVRKIQDTLKDYGYLFPENSIWFKSVTEVADSIQ